MISQIKEDSFKDDDMKDPTLEPYAKQTIREELFQSLEQAKNLDK